MMQEIMDWLKAQPRRVPVVAGCSTAFGCSIDGVVPTAKTVALAKGLADAGVDQIMLADTVGYAHPAQIKEVVRATRDAIGVTLYGLHLHDTCGLGIANALAGLEEGIRAFDSCLAGLGGCPYAPGASGNVVTEDLVFMLESMGFSTGIDLQKLIEARRCCMRACRRSRCTARCPRPASRGRSAQRRSDRQRNGLTIRTLFDLAAVGLAVVLIQQRHGTIAFRDLGRIRTAGPAKLAPWITLDGPSDRFRVGRCWQVPGMLAAVPVIWNARWPGAETPGRGCPSSGWRGCRRIG